jgi:hypothetical protein
VTETLELTLPAELQSLIEKRLDLVDRVLQDARVSRSERTTILQELEGQILQLVERRSEQPTRDDVLSVLSELDPPEAFLSNGTDASPELEPFRKAYSRVEIPTGPHPLPSAAPSTLALSAGFLVSGVSLSTGLLMSVAVWVAPELTLALVATIQIAALIGSAMGVAWLLQSRSHAASGLERTVAAVAAGTGPLTLAFLLAIAALFYEIEIAAYVLAGFVGGAWVHGIWLGVATCLLWLGRPSGAGRQ